MKNIVKIMVFAAIIYPANLFAGPQEILGTWSCSYKILFKKYTEEFTITSAKGGKLSGTDSNGVIHGSYKGNDVYLMEKDGSTEFMSGFFFNAAGSNPKGKYLMITRLPFGSYWYDMACEKVNLQ